MARSTEKKSPAKGVEEYEGESPDGYQQVYAGIPFVQPEGKAWELACCHCGLVHSVKIENDGIDRDGGVLKITMRENAAATRRHRRVAGEAPELDAAYEKGYSDGLRTMANITAAAKNLRRAQERYLAHRTERNGAAVGRAAIALDKALIRPRQLDNKKAAP